MACHFGQKGTSVDNRKGRKRTKKAEKTKNNILIYSNKILSTMSTNFHIC